MSYTYASHTKASLVPKGRNSNNIRSMYTYRATQYNNKEINEARIRRHS